MRYVILVAAVLMQMCLGATYSWSVYVAPLKELTGLQQGPVQIPFTTFYFIFPLSMLIAGNFLTKIGTRRSAMIGGILFGGGWLLASLGSFNFVYTVLGIGVLSGIGAGMAYIVPIAVCIQWFPKSKGLVTGVAVAGFGGGAALVSQVGGYCMNILGYTPFQTFFLFGAVFLCTVFSAGSTMKAPVDRNETKDQGSIRIFDILRNPTFLVLYLAMFIGLAAGFTINANIKEMFSGIGDIVSIGIMAVSLFALANALGRILWGALFDRIGTTVAISGNLLFQGLVFAFASILAGSGKGFLLLAFLTGFNYGGVLVVYVSSVSRKWGAENVGRIYGFLFSSNIPASLAPLIAAMIFDKTGNFNIVFTVLSVVLMSCSFFLMFQKKLFLQKNMHI